jgi:Putative adhesin
MKKFNLVLRYIALFLAISFKLQATSNDPQAISHKPQVATNTVQSVRNKPQTKSVQPDPEDPSCTCNSKQEFTKNFDKTFTVDKNEVVILANKYGKIEVKTGGTNQVVVNVRVRVNATSQEDAQTLFNRINIAFSNGPDYVKTETIIESQSGGTWRWNWGKSNSQDFTIDYDVTMPANSRLDLSNKYGNSHIAALNAAVNVEQKYGDFKLDGATAAVIELAYGGGQLGTISALNATVSYGKLTSPNVSAAKIKSKYSQLKLGTMQMAEIQTAYDDYKIDEVETLKVDGKYGDFSVGTVKDVTFTGSYTDINIGKIDGNGDFQTNYGDVSIDAVKAGFGNINIKANYTDFTIKIDPSVNYLLDASGSYGDIKHPVSIKTSMDSKTNSRYEIVGTVGTAGSKSVLKARMNYGDLKIR